MEVQSTECWFQDGTITSGVLKPGTYRGRLMDIRPGKRPSLDGDGDKLCLTFIFAAEEGSRVTRTVNSSTSERSPCMTLIRALAGTNQPDAAVVADPKRLQHFVTSLIGDDYLVTVEPSKCGRFNNLVTSTPTTKESDDH